MSLSHQSLAVSAALDNAEALASLFQRVRQYSEQLAVPLSAEDAQIQSMPDASPTKWHLAHTSWFFETFVLRQFDPDHQPFDPAFAYLFNSYYEGEGPRHARPERGLITRPSLDRVRDYRQSVTARVLDLIDRLEAGKDWSLAAGLIELGCHHEQQHQELILTDIKHALAQNPLMPGYASPYPKEVRSIADFQWIDRPGGLAEFGADGDGFAFDNEGPRHKTFVERHALANRLSTNRDFRAFIDDGGYRRPEF